MDVEEMVKRVGFSHAAGEFELTITTLFIGSQNDVNELVRDHDHFTR